jgi:hypothetical protein
MIVGELVSIEYSSSSDVQLMLAAQSRVISAVEKFTAFQLLRHDRNEFGLGIMESGPSPSALELLTIEFGPIAIYVAFHAASKVQRESLGISQRRLAGRGAMAVVATDVLGGGLRPQ